jgi:hypothetical protein
MPRTPPAPPGIGARFPRGGWIGLTKYWIDRRAQKTPVIEIDDNDTDQRQAKKLLFFVARFLPGKALHLARGLDHASAQEKPFARSLIQMNASALRFANLFVTPARKVAVYIAIGKKTILAGAARNNRLSASRG